MSWLIVTNDNIKLPEHTVYTYSEFIDIASSDDGIEVDEGILFDRKDMTSNIWEAVSCYKDVGVSVHLFDNRFNVSYFIKNYQTLDIFGKILNSNLNKILKSFE